MKIHWVLLLLLPALPFGVNRGVVAADSPSPAKPVMLRGETLLPPDSDALAWRWGVKLASLGPTNDGTRDEFADPASLERRMDELSKAGYNAVICNGLHFHLCFPDRWAMWKDNMVKIVEAAHRRNIKVIEHYDVPVLYYRGEGLRYLLDHVDWLQRDIRFDCPNLHAACLNHPEFRKDYLTRLENFVRATKVDGVMLDECAFADESLCGCRYCREKFTAETGCVLPWDETSPVLFNREHPLWVTWLKWRVKTLGDWWVDVRRTLNKVNPNISILAYTTHGGFTTAWSMRDSGSDLAGEKGRACDFLGTEIMSRNVFDCYRPVFAYRKMKAALGQSRKSPIFGLVYHVGDENFAYFGWALCHMNAQATWMATIEGADMNHYVDWPEQMDLRRAAPVADIAVLFSNATRKFGRHMDHLPDLVGTSECLSDVHLQHDFILDDDLVSERLGRYKLLVLPSACCLSAEQVQAIRRYVSGGGRLLVSGHASLFNEDGFGGDNFQLADVMGVDYADSLTSGPLRLKMQDGSTLDYSDKAVKTRLRPGATALGELYDDKGQVVGPAIVANTYGKGECRYLAARLASLNYQPEQTVKDRWTYVPNDMALLLYIDLVQHALVDGPVLREVHVPRKVLVSLYRDERDGQSQWIIHLLNVTGSRLKPGQTVPPTKSLPAFPPLEEDVVFDVRAPGASSGYVVSPDYPGRRPVKLADIGAGYCRVTVSKSDLKAYATVHVENATK
jgi:hypothetical protein